MADFDPARYGRLLAEALPGMIETAEEHERFLTIAEEMMDRGETLSAEERKLLELLVLLIELFEREVEGEEEEETEAEIPLPHETLKRLMESRGWDDLVLNDIFGNPKLVSEALTGRKAITKGQAKALGKLFRVPPKLFFSE